mgnify:FL=1
MEPIGQLPQVFVQYPPGKPSPSVAQKAARSSPHWRSLEQPSPTGTAQRPNEHVEPVGQTLPHSPQWDGSELVLTQLPPQAVRPASHTQLPSAQT